jgi:thioredoxin reductase
MQILDVAIIGAGPYGLSIAAHLKKAGVPHRIFGVPMESWANSMPRGMALKSDGRSSDLADPDGIFSLKAYCESQGYPHDDTQWPIPVEIFTAYGCAFQKRYAAVEEKRVTALKALSEGYLLEFDDGEFVTARQVVVAVGIIPFAYLPEPFRGLAGERLTHSSQHGPIDVLAGRRVIIIGAGSSALDLAALLHEQGNDVLVAARSGFEFHAPPLPRAIWRQMLRPGSGIGNGWSLRLCCELPRLFHRLPEETRLRLVGRLLGPSGGWFMKDRLANVPLMSPWRVLGAKVRDKRVELRFAGLDGMEWSTYADHVIAATGFKIDLSRLTFLSGDLLEQLRLVKGAPVLSDRFESSLPGLFFVGPTSMASFGPLVRFVFGAAYTARSISSRLTPRRRLVYLAQNAPAKA